MVFAIKHMKRIKPTILLSFDVEEFDLPIEYGIKFPLDDQMDITLEGLNIIAKIIKTNNISCTFFSTANFAQCFPDQIRDLSQNHEIGSHSCYHSSFQEADLQISLSILESIISKKVFGIRIPRMKKIDSILIKEAGYAYDSSINPTWIPGRYNNLFAPRTWYLENGIVRLPVSVSPHLRIPLFWLLFKNFPYKYFKMLALQCLHKDGYLCLYFHPWEFTDLNSYPLPTIIKRKSGIALQDQLQKLLTDLKKEGEFITIHTFIDKLNL